MKYGLSISSRVPSNGDVISVKCKFCEHFGRECVKNVDGCNSRLEEIAVFCSLALATRKRKRSENSKYFKAPFYLFVK